MRRSSAHKSSSSELLPLSRIQQGLLLHSELESKNQFYISQIKIALHHAVDAQLLEQCCQRVVNRHAILRASITSKNLQHADLRIHPEITVQLKIHDLSSYTRIKSEKSLQNLLEKDFSQKMDILTAPLMRWTLIKISRSRSLFVWTHHHALLSGNEIAKVLMELFAYYDDGNRTPETDDHSHDYLHYIDLLQKTNPAAHEKYWQKQLQDYEPKELLIAKKKPLSDVYRHAMIVDKLPAISSRQLKQLAKEQDVTEYTVLMSAWALVLSLFSNESDIVFGTVRSFPDESLKNVAGLFINTLPIRVQLAAKTSVKSLLKSIRQQQLQLRKMVHTPLGEINKSIALEPGKNLFETYIDYKPLSINELLKKSNRSWHNRHWDYRLDTHYKLYLEIYGENNGLVFRIHYDENTYTPETIQPLMTYFQNILSQLHTEKNIVDIDGLSKKDHQLRDKLCQGATRRYPKHPSVIKAFELHAKKQANEIALVENDVAMTYEQLDRLANQLAHKIMHSVKGRGQFIGVCLEKSYRYVVAILAIQKTGNAYVPLDLHSPVERLKFIIKDCKMPAIIAENSLLKATKNIIYRSDADLLKESSQAIQRISKATDPAYAIYTSGTTGQPKGVEILHHSLLNLTLWHQHEYFIDSSKNIGLVSPFTFDAATWMLWSALANGAQLHLIADDIVRDPLLLQQKLISDHIDQAFIPAAMVSTLLALKWPKTHSFKQLLTGGEKLNLVAMPPKDMLVLNHYGPTEYTVITTVNLDYHNIKDINHIGKPIDNTRVHVRDCLSRTSPLSIMGELCISGDGMAKGYIRAPQSSQTAFVTEKKFGKLYKTGDLVRLLPDGQIDFIGRRDDQVKIRGYRIELGEIENVFARCAWIDSCCTKIISNSKGQKQIVLYYTQNAQRSVSLETYAKEHLPSYMIPNAYVCVKKFALTKHGKIDKSQLPTPDKLLLKPSGDIEKSSPVNTTTKVIYQIIADILAIKPNKLNSQASLFDYGGDSITVMQIIQQLHAAGLTITADQIFKRPIIADIASHASASRKNSSSAHPLPKLHKSFPVTPIQQWYLSQANITHDQFNQSVHISLRKKMNFSQLEIAFKYLIEKHDSLRLKFQKRKNKWVASSHTDKTQFTLQKNLDDCENVHFNLNQGLLLFAAVNQAVEPTELFISIHHLAVDIVSWQILLQDLEYFYEKLGSSKSLRTHKIISHFQYWAQQLQRHGTTLFKGIRAEYWRETLANYKQIYKDFSRIPRYEKIDNHWADVRHLVTALPEKITQLLVGKANRAYNTRIIDLVVTALFDSFSSNHIQSHLLALLMESHGRTTLSDIEPNEIVGWFTTLAPVVIRSDSDDYAEKIRLVKDSLQDFQEKAFSYSLLSSQGGSQFKNPIPESELIGFNYLGVLHTKPKQQSMIEHQSVISLDVEPDKKRPLLIELLVYILDSKLHIDVTFNHHRMPVKKMRKQLVLFSQALENLVKHCCNQSHQHYSTSDFPLLTMSQQELDQFMQENMQPLLHDKVKLVDLYPLSPLQEGIHYHALKHADSDFYHVQTLLDIHDQLNVDQFREATLNVIAHFDIFRTGFVASHILESVQFVVSEVTIPWQFHDLSSLSQSEQNSKFHDLITIDRQRLFNLSHPPLVRCYLVKFNENHYQFVLSYHHIILGGWSMSMIVNYLFSYYHAIKNQTIYTLPTANAYKPYVEWTLKSDHKKAKTYWTKLLASFDVPTKLTNESYQQCNPHFHDAREKLSTTLDVASLTQIRQFAKQHELTLNTVLLGIWCYVISRFSDCKDVVMGTTLATRPAEIDSIETRVGLFNSTLPIRSTYSGNETLTHFLQGMQKQLRESQKYQYTKLVDIQRYSGLSNHDSLFDILFVFENYPLDKKKLKEFKVESLQVIEKPHFKISLTVMATDQLELNLNYDIAAFTRKNIDQLMSCYLTVLTKLNKKSDLLMRDLEIVSPEHKQALIQSWQGQTLSFDHSRFLRDDYQDQFNQIPTKTAVIFNDIKITYHTLDTQSSKLANQLLTARVKPGQVVAIILNRDLDLIYTIVAIVKLGCTLLPIDPNHPKQRIADIIDDAKPRLIVTKKIFSQKLDLPTDKILYLDLSKADIAAQATQLPELTLSNLTPAYILFTSGSTGKPKGVAISYASLLNFLHSAKELTHIHSQQHFLISTTYAFDIFQYEFHSPFILGATATLIEHKDQIDGVSLNRIIESNQVDVIQATPVTWNLLLTSGFVPKKNQVLISGGDVMTKQLTANLLKNGARVYNIYGPSETTIWSSCHETTTMDEQQPSIPIGIPMHNTYFYLLNSDYQLMPNGLLGTLFIGGAGVGLGYLKNKKLTKLKFIADPFKPGEVIYNSGDLVKLSDSGAFLFIGRSDNQVKIRGYRIELSEIESQLNQLKQIKQSAVIIKESAEHEKQIIAFISKQPSANKLTKAQLRNALSTSLPAFMIPNHFEYVDKMPLTISRKIDKKALATIELKQSTTQTTHQLPKKYQPLITIWTEILALSADSVNLDDNFFTVGGNSIQAVSMITKINHAMSTELGINDLFVYPTIRALYDQIQVAKKKIQHNTSIHTISLQAPIVCLQNQGKGQPIFLLHPIGGTLYIYQPLIQSLGRTRPVYGIHDPSITAGDLIFSSLREMAGYYLTLIKQQQPVGPYYLLGASFGANMVEEITKQLIQQGDSVAFTGLIDGWAHYPAKSHQKDWFYQNLSRQHKMVAELTGHNHNELPQSLLAINWHRQQLLAKHDLTYSENKITLFKAQELTPVLSNIDSEFNYWDMYYPAGMNLHLVPGDHETMLLPPNVSTLAKAILLYLNDE